MNNIFTIMIMGMLATAGMIGVEMSSNEREKQAIEAVNAEWRKAAAPVFKARYMSGLESNATPQDLTRALDVNSVMTHSETYKWLPGQGLGLTRIVITGPE